MSLFNEDADGFYLYSVEYPEQPFKDMGQVYLFYHVPETWECVLSHLSDGFRECPETEELWLGTLGNKDVVQLWRRT